MPRVHFSIRYLLAAIALVCVACAAIRFPTVWCMSLSFSLAVALLSMATIACFVARAELRAFAVGFALAGWIHLVLALTTWFDQGSGLLVASRTLLDLLADPLGNAMPPNSYIEEKGLLAAMAGYVPGSPPDKYYKYIVIGQSFITLMLALVGGLAGQLMHRRCHGRE